MDNLTQFPCEHILGCIAITANSHGLGHAKKRLVTLRVSVLLQNRHCIHELFASSVRLKSCARLPSASDTNINPRTSLMYASSKWVLKNSCELLPEAAEH
jgi:hypothetical protein